MKKVFCAVLTVAVVAALAAGCSREKGGIDDVKEDKKAPAEEAEGKSKGSNDRVQDILTGMSLEEKVGQVFITSLRYLPDTKAALELTGSAGERIKSNKPGGVILFAENLQTIPQTRKLIEDMQSASSLPMFIAIDEEGGATSRLNASPGLHSTKLPSNSVVGRTRNPELARKAARVIAEEISSLGFNMNFAPVADVDSNPKNPVIGVRSFGPDQELVAKMVEAQVAGMHEVNIITVLKHFPGHGDTSTDTHTGAVVIGHNKDRLQKVELIPFSRGITAGSDGVMTAHIQIPEIAKDKKPATLSKDILTGMLRNEMNFGGLIITDALEMGAISRYYTPGEAAIMAFEAGADILLMPHPVETAIDGLLRAVKEGRITEERLDESVRRILGVKLGRGILDNKQIRPDPEKVLGSREHLEVAEEILRESKRQPR